MTECNGSTKWIEEANNVIITKLVKHDLFDIIVNSGKKKQERAIGHGGWGSLRPSSPISTNKKFGNKCVKKNRTCRYSHAGMVRCDNEVATHGRRNACVSEPPLSGRIYTSICTQLPG